MAHAGEVRGNAAAAVIKSGSGSSARIVAAVSQGYALGWENGAPLALSLAGTFGPFPARIAV